MEAPEKPDQGFDINTSYREYETVHEDIHEKVSYKDFVTLNINMVRRRGTGENKAHKTLISCVRWEG
jgi:hypothetical protein